jgi:hypothetical protein
MNDTYIITVYVMIDDILRAMNVQRLHNRTLIERFIKVYVSLIVLSLTQSKSTYI